MPDPPRSERIKPCLLDRLTDDDPGTKEESRLQRVVPPERYLKSVLRDLLWLFSTRTHPADYPIPTDAPRCAVARRNTGSNAGRNQDREGAGERVLSDYPEASRSVLAFGIPDLAGVTSAELVFSQLGKELEDAVRCFEPRINPKTLRMKPMLLADGQPDKPLATSICFELQADLWMEPIPEHLHLRTVIDLETGQCELLNAAHEP